MSWNWLGNFSYEADCINNHRWWKAFSRRQSSSAVSSRVSISDVIICEAPAAIGPLPLVCRRWRSRGPGGRIGRHQSMVDFVFIVWEATFATPTYIVLEASFAVPTALCRKQRLLFTIHCVGGNVCSSHSNVWEATFDVSTLLCGKQQFLCTVYLAPKSDL